MFKSQSDSTFVTYGTKCTAQDLLVFEPNAQHFSTWARDTTKTDYEHYQNVLNICYVISLSILCFAFYSVHIALNITALSLY